LYATKERAVHAKVARKRGIVIQFMEVFSYYLTCEQNAHSCLTGP
jgi:hypothetical protein